MPQSTVSIRRLKETPSWLRLTWGAFKRIGIVSSALTRLTNVRRSNTISFPVKVQLTGSLHPPLWMWELDTHSWHRAQDSVLWKQVLLEVAKHIIQRAQNHRICKAANYHPCWRPRTTINCQTPQTFLVWSHHKSYFPGKDHPTGDGRGQTEKRQTEKPGWITAAAFQTCGRSRDVGIPDCPSIHRDTPAAP